MNNEMLPNANDDNIKLIAIKEGSPSTTSEDLILIRNYDSNEFTTVPRNNSPLNSDDLTDEYVLFASDVMDYIDKDNYVVASSKPSSELQLSITPNLQRKEEIGQQQFSQTYEDAESTRGSSEMNEIEFVLLPSNQDEKLKPESNVKSLATGATQRLQTTVARPNVPNTPNRNLKNVAPTAAVISNVNVNPTVRTQPVILTNTKKLMSEVTQTTAKVSIGNTTISVPLLKPLNSSQIPTTSLFTEANNRLQQPLTKLQQQQQKPQQHQQKQQLNLSKILNVKRTCPKVNQPTIVSLSQLQVKPVSTAKIVQAKLVNKKMQLQIPNQIISTTSATSSSTTFGTSGTSGLLTTSADARPKPSILQNVSFIKSPTKKELISSSASNDESGINITTVAGISVSEQLTNSVDNFVSNTSNSSKLKNLRDTQSNDIKTTLSTFKRNEGTSTSSTVTTLRNLKTSLNPTCTTTVKKILASASMHNSPPLLMPLCKSTDQQHHVQSLANAKRNVIGSTVSIIKQAPQSTQLIAIAGTNSNVTSISTVPISDSNTTRPNSESYDVLTSKSQPTIVHAGTENANKMSAGTALITVPRNISVLLAKNEGNQQQMKSTTFTNTTTTSISTHPGASKEQFAKKLNICRSGSLNITAVTLPQSLSNSMIQNVTCKTVESVASTNKSPIVSVATSIPVSQTIVHTVESNINTTASLVSKPVKMPSSTSALTLFGIPSVKRARILDADVVEHEENLQSAVPTSIKRSSLDISGNKITEITVNENLAETVKCGNKEQTLSSLNVDKPAEVKSLTQPTQPTQPTLTTLRQEDTHNVLLKQLLQNTTNNSTTISKSPSPPVCNQILSARKVINVRAPSLGLVSSLEAQLARPVIPPVPTTGTSTSQISAAATTTTITESSSPKTSLPKLINTESEKSMLNDTKQKPLVQIISKETSFVSSPCGIANIQQQQTLANGIPVRTSLPEHSITQASTTLVTTSNVFSRLAETLVTTKQSTSAKNEPSVLSSDKSSSLVIATQSENKLDVTKLNRNEIATTIHSTNIQPIITTSSSLVTGNLGVMTNSHSNLYIQQRKIFPEIGSTPESPLVDKTLNQKNSSKILMETPITSSVENSFQTNDDKLSVEHNDPPDANMGGSLHVNVISKIQPLPNQALTPEASTTSDILQKKSTENFVANSLNPKIIPVKDPIKDAEMRKKRKRDYQKHRRQLNHRDGTLNATATTSAVSGGPVNKKRPKKPLKVEEDYDNFNENLMCHIRQMQPLQVLEPILSRNYNACKIYGKCTNKDGSSGFPNDELAGDFGSAKFSQVEGLYEKEKRLIDIEMDDKRKVLTIQNDFYDQEFLPIMSGNEQDQIIRFLGTIRERHVETLDIINNKNNNNFSSATDSQQLSKWNTFASLSYPGLILRHSGSSQILGRMSPVVPFVEPTLQNPKRLPLSFLCDEEAKCLPPDEKPSVNILKINSESPDRIGNSQTVVLSLTPSAVNNVLGVLKDLANLLNIATPTNFKVIDINDSNEDNKTSLLTTHKLPNVFKKATLQQILNGKSKICAKCGRTIESDGIRCSKKAFNNCITSILVMSTSECSIYFCSRSCYTSARNRSESRAFNPKTSVSASNLAEQNRLLPVQKTENALPKMNEKMMKKRRFKYFSSKCFTPTLAIKHPSEKEMIDILFKMDITVAPNNVIKSLSGSSVIRSIDDVRQCVLCRQLGDGVPDGPSRLLNFDIDKYVHLNCALWSNGVYETISGGLMNLNVAVQSGLSLACTACQQLGATVKCFKNRCGTVFHLPCALKKDCVFYKNKTMHCQQHALKTEKENELSSLSVYRRVFIERDENRQVAAVMHHSELSNLLRVGSLTFLNVGQLLPHQLEAFHNNNYIYPIGYKITRFYWSMKRPNKRCRYICTIVDVSGKPEFRIQVQEKNESDIELQDTTPNGVWQKVLESIAALRRNNELVQLFPRHITGEDLFGLTEPAIVRIIESLPGVESLTDYRFKYGRNPLLELPLAINPSGSARTEPKQRQIIGWRKPHTQRTGTFSNQRVSNSITSIFTGEVTCPYSKQFVHSKSSQYKKMKQEWRNNVYLARSKIQGLGLYAARDMERHTMIIEYIGEVIRTEVSEIREKQYESRNRGIYMFRLDEERVVDATLSGGLARYINHSCNPNCVTEIVEVDRELRIIIFAKRRINRGEELSYDYKFDIEDDANKIQCMCGAPNCRKWMN